MSYSPDYFTTRFLLTCKEDFTRLKTMVESAPVALLTGYATTGEVWSDEKNTAADESLKAEIMRCEPIRITGINPTETHCEPGWAVHMPLSQALALAERYHQDAIYYIISDQLWIYGSTPMESRTPTCVGPFLERVLVR